MIITQQQCESETRADDIIRTGYTAQHTAATCTVFCRRREEGMGFRRDDDAGRVYGLQFPDQRSRAKRRNSAIHVHDNAPSPLQVNRTKRSACKYIHYRISFTSCGAPVRCCYYYRWCFVSCCLDILRQSEKFCTLRREDIYF